MKKIISIIAITALILASVPTSFAASSATVNIKVVIDHTISIVIGGGDDSGHNIIFQNMKVSTTKVCANAITVKNDGTGIGEKITTDVAASDGFTVKLQLTDTDEQPQADDSNWKDAGTGVEVGQISHDVTKYLWVLVTTPATYGSLEKDIALTINASVTP